MGRAPPRDITELCDDDKIFVQLASYRDPQLLPTIESLLENADDPNRFVFGICWQYGPEEDPNVFDGNEKYRVYKAHYSESRGLGWARNITNSLYNGETFTLQIDSHHRFLKSWDTMMLQDYFQACKLSDKPIITTYVPPFTPGQPLPIAAPTLMSQYEFSSDKLLMSMPWYIPNHQTLSHVIRARTISAHFFFTSGSFIEEVPYDPDTFFGGYVEEITLSARAFTHGYDFFSPYRCYLFHEYTRVGRPKIWEDNPSQTCKWDIHARNKTRQLMGQEDHGIDMGKYGLGSVRTFHDWEEYGGFDFKNCRIQQYTLDVKEPPNPTPWQEHFIMKSFCFQIVWNADMIKEDVENKPNAKLVCITLGLETSSGFTLHRADMLPTTHPDVFDFAMNETIIEFKSFDTPVKWVMWPLFDNQEWGTRQDGTL